MRPLRLGIVPYLNVLPLLEGLDRDFPAGNWVRATPRELAEMLEAQAIDVAIVSSHEGLRRAPAYRLVPGACIGSEGPVRSVMLYSKVPLAHARTVLLDRASLTSIHLCRILLAERHGLLPEFHTAPEPLTRFHPWEDLEEDAFLVIGDAALALRGKFPFQLDLGEAWKQHTGLPFVFAAWWVRQGLELLPSEAAAFARARESGTANIHRVVARLSPEELIPYGGIAGVADYLRNAIRFELGARELEGLELFRTKLLRHGLLPSGKAEPLQASASPGA